MEQKNHTWSFVTVGGVKRVNLESGKDLVNLIYLDPKLWTALSCPVNGLEIDLKTLQFIDTDNDGQIRLAEVIGAVEWTISVIKDPDELLKQSAIFPLSVINENTEAGKILLNAAKIVLKHLDKADATVLTVEDTTNLEKIFSGTAFNGDGIITEDSTQDTELIQFISDVMKYEGAVTDRGAKQGVSDELVKQFFEHCEAYTAWYAKKDADLNGVLPLGDSTGDAYRNRCTIQSKVDDFFLRCSLAAYDSESTNALNLHAARVEAITEKNLSDCIEEIAGYPLAKIEPGGSLPVSAAINPAWEKDIAAFKQLTVNSLLPGQDSITSADWNMICTLFDRYAKWQAEKEGAVVEPLGIDRIREILSGDLKEKMAALMVQENAVKEEADNIMRVDQLVRYYRDLFTLLKNFVTFFDFYSPEQRAIFESGTLYIDQRSCNLCLKVSDMPKHATMANFSGMYLLYLDCTSRATKAKMTIVAALTNGDIDDMIVGKNALFYDRKGLDWDATVVKIVDNPISIRQAFFSPYRKLSRFITTQTNKMAAAQDEKANANLTKGVESTAAKPGDPVAKKDPPPPFDVGKFVGIFAAIGLAIGAIGTALAAALGGLMKLTWWKMPLVFLGIILLISGPSMIIAYLKLRKRNLAPLLDANGWAINARVIVNIQFGNTLTHLAEIPKGSKINFNDPFRKKKNPLLPALIIILIVAAVVVFLFWKYKFI
jgi:hypothetical protein